MYLMLRPTCVMCFRRVLKRQSARAPAHPLRLHRLRILISSATTVAKLLQVAARSNGMHVYTLETVRLRVRRVIVHFQTTATSSATRYSTRGSDRTSASFVRAHSPDGSTCGRMHCSIWKRASLNRRNLRLRRNGGSGTAVQQTNQRTITKRRRVTLPNILNANRVHASL